MFDAGDFNPMVFWLHVVLGFGSAIFAGIALFSRKGGKWHRRTGQLFALAMGVAVVTAFYFLAVGPFAPPILISTSAAIYAIGMAILSLRPRSGGWIALQASLVVVPVLIGLLYLAFAVLAVGVPEIPLYLAVLGPAAGILFLALAWQDARFLRTSEPAKDRRIKRHGFRMALVTAEVVRAPAISLGPQFLGDATFDFYSFGPFLLVPLVYYLAMPAWLKSNKEAPAPA